MLETLDAAAVRRWCDGGLEALRAHQREIDDLNVYPVPDGDTGTNLVLTLTAAHEALSAEFEAIELETAKRGDAGRGDAALEAAGPAVLSERAAVAGLMRRMARGALLGARGNSGVIVSQILRGMADTFAGAVVVRGSELARALRTATDAAYAAVARPVEGTVLSVVAAAAEGAGRIKSDNLVTVARAAARAATEALARTPQQLPVLARAGVVDAGGRGLCLLLDALVAAIDTGAPDTSAGQRGSATVTGAPDTSAGQRGSATVTGIPTEGDSSGPAGMRAGEKAPASYSGPPDGGASDGVSPREDVPGEGRPVAGSVHAGGVAGGGPVSASGGVASSGTAGGDVMRSGAPGSDVSGGGPVDAARTHVVWGVGLPVDRELSSLGPAGGGSVPGRAESGGGPVQEQGCAGFGYEVQFLLDAEDAAVDRLRLTLDELGDSLVIVGTGDGDPPTWNVHVHVTEIGPAVEAAITAGRPYRINVSPLEERRAEGDRRGAVVVAAGDGLTALFEAEGAVVVDRNPSTAEILAAIAATGAGSVVLLPNDTNTHAVAVSAAREAESTGVRVSVVPTRSPVQALAALAVRDGQRPFADDVIAMAEAAGACRYGEVCTAQRDALTVAGQCRAGDLLGLVDGEVHVIGDDVAEVSRRLLDRMLGGGGELVTCVLGADAPPGFEEELRGHVHRTWPFIELQCFAGGQPHYHLLAGVE